MAGTTTYVQLVNKAIQEAGVDLASFAADGSDFATNTNAMLQRFSGWTSRAWKSIQQECYDWEFMNETAVVNLDPGIMFYRDINSTVTMSGAANTTVSIYDQDLSVAVPSVALGTFTDLTGKYTGITQSTGNGIGYYDISGTSYTAPIQFALKAGAEFIYCPASVTKDTFIDITATSGSYGGFVNNIPSTKFALTKDINGLEVVWDGSSTSTRLKYYYNAGDGTPHIAPTASFADPSTGQVLVSWTSLPSDLTVISGSAGYQLTVYNGGQLHVHGWKSFNFDEEISAGDFQESIQEINPQSFKIIDYYAGAPAQELPLPFMSWESFRNAYSQPAAYPGAPRLITEDNTGRWQLYPQPQQRYTVKFDYIRQPQILSAFGDIPKGINDDFMDVIMWQTLIYYGEYDEQPSVVIRATKHYRDLLSRLEQKNREKFHLKPKRLW